MRAEVVFPDLVELRFLFTVLDRTRRQANLKSAYYKLDNDKLNVTFNPAVYKKLLFALCFFHASVQVKHARHRHSCTRFAIPTELLLAVYLYVW